MSEALSSAVLAIAREDLAAQIREPSPKKSSDDMRRLYFEPIGLPEGSNWCAASIASWLRRAAARTGRPSPIAGSAGAKATMDQFRKAGLWIERADLHEADVRPGMIAVWDRSKPDDPKTSWWGHIGVVATPVMSGSYESIDGNSGPAGGMVAQMTRRFDDPRLLGMARLDDAAATAGVEVHAVQDEEEGSAGMIVGLALLVALGGVTYAHLR